MKRKNAVSRFAGGAKAPRSFAQRILAERRRMGTGDPQLTLGFFSARFAPAR